MSRSTIFFIVFGVLLLISFFALSIWHYRKWDSQYGRFDQVSEKDSFHSKFVTLRVYKGYSYIRIGGSRQFILGEQRNYNYTKYSLYELITECDSIVKNESSDTVYIFTKRYKEKYEFLLHDDIQKLQKRFE